MSSKIKKRRKPCRFTRFSRRGYNGCFRISQMVTGNGSYARLYWLEQEYPQPVIRLLAEVGVQTMAGTCIVSLDGLRTASGVQTMVDLVAAINREVDVTDVLMDLAPHNRRGALMEGLNMLCLESLRGGRSG